MYHCTWPEVAQYPPYWDRFTGSDVIKRHLTPKEFTWKGGMRACPTGSRWILPIREYFDRKWRYETSCDPVELPLENMEARMGDQKWGFPAFVLTIVVVQNVPLRMTGSEGCPPFCRVFLDIFEVFRYRLCLDGVHWSLGVVTCSVIG